MSSIKVLVVGGGNIGATLACHIKHSHPEHNVRMYVRDDSRFGDSLEFTDVERGEKYRIVLDSVSSDPSSVARDAEIVFICLPHFAVEKAFSDLARYVANDCLVGVVPGSGGCEFCFDKIFCGRARLFGFQRVPFVARLNEYGHSTSLLGWKPFSVVGSLRRCDLETACETVRACGLETDAADNFLAVSLAPSNPIIHTTCVYGLFRAHRIDESYSRVKRLYEEWSDKESSIMITMDEELHRLFNAIPELDMSSVKPLTKHYESPDAAALTKKILSIPSFHDLLSPMKTAEDGKAKVDLSSRMFVEDFPYGLAIIRAFGEIFGIGMPTVDRVLGWYSEWVGAGYYVGGRFAGPGLKKTGIPQNYGIRTPSQVVELYRN